MNEVRESVRPGGASRADLHGWYADELLPKVARAVAQGRVDPRRACELHRLMTNLGRPRARHHAAEAGR